MEVNIPLEINKDNDKIVWLYRAVELMRLEHNEKGAKFRNKEISKEEWDDYTKEHLDKTVIISAKINEIKSNMKNDTKYSIDIKEIFSDI